MRNFDGQNTQISQDFTASNLPGSKNQCYNIREVVSVELNFEGVVVGVTSLVIIGAFHPLVIWFEYHFTQSIWPVFLIAGLLCLIAALFIQGLFSVLLGLLGVACIWSIRELKEQARRVERGWFPKNPKRK